MLSWEYPGLQVPSRDHSPAFAIGSSILRHKISGKKFCSQEKLPHQDGKRPQPFSHWVFARCSVLFPVWHADLLQDFLAHNDLYLEPVSSYHTIVRNRLHSSTLSHHRANLSICNRRMLRCMARHSLGREWRVKLNRTRLLLYTALLCSFPSTSSHLFRRSF